MMRVFFKVFEFELDFFQFRPEFIDLALEAFGADVHVVKVDRCSQPLQGPAEVLRQGIQVHVDQALLFHFGDQLFRGNKLTRMDWEREAWAAGRL